jgi:predicted RNA-binding Zn ribbon-like protein
VAIKLIRILRTKRAMSRPANPTGTHQGDYATPTEEEPGGREPAPGDLRQVQLFINSLDIEAGVDQFDKPRTLSEWLYMHHLTESPLRVSPADLDRAKRFREALRTLAVANNGRLFNDADLASVNRAFTKFPLVAAFHPAGNAHLEPGGHRLEHALGHLAAIVITETITGRWARVKACSRDACRWVYYDHSRSATGKWCTMMICGSREKANAYYRRHAAADRRRR